MNSLKDCITQSTPYKWIEPLKKGALNFLFPVSCIHCNHLIEGALEEVLCPTCQTLIDPIKLDERCIICNTLSHERVCRLCQRGKQPFTAYFAPFEKEGPPLSIASSFEQGKRSELSLSIVESMLYFLPRLGWEKPSLILPYPLSLDKRWKLTENPHETIAHSIGKRLFAPSVPYLKRALDDDFLFLDSPMERKRKLWERISLKKGADFRNHVIYFVACSFHENTPLEICLHKIKQKRPRKLYVLSFLHPFD